MEIVFVVMHCIHADVPLKNRKVFPLPSIIAQSQEQYTSISEKFPSLFLKLRHVFAVS